MVHASPGMSFFVDATTTGYILPQGSNPMPIQCCHQPSLAVLYKYLFSSSQALTSSESRSIQAAFALIASML